ncbi:MAG: hypothetical protein ACPGXL_06015 [Chitinophagales bacterium]
MRYTANTLKKLEALLKESDYQVRTGKGTFNSGYCILQSKKVVVLNKYHSMDARIIALIEIIKKLDIDMEILSESAEKLYEEILATT